MKIAIIGSRSFDNYGKLESFVLSRISLSDISEVVSGGARGADTLAALFAEVHNVPLRLFPAEWDSYGKQAGFLRNQKIIDYCDKVFAFWDGSSKGTSHSIELAKNAGKPTYLFLF